MWFAHLLIQSSIKKQNIFSVSSISKPSLKSYCVHLSQQMGNSNQLCDESIINAQDWQLKCCFTGSISQEFSIKTEESFHYCCWAACGKPSRQMWIFKCSWVLMYIPAGSYLSHRSFYSLHLLLTPGISCFQGRLLGMNSSNTLVGCFSSRPP